MYFKIFLQVYQSTTPLEAPFRIVNIPELLKLILESVVSKDMDAEEDAEEEVKVDVAEEEVTANMTPTP